jgi:hypothetical protein
MVNTPSLAVVGGWRLSNKSLMLWLIHHLSDMHSPQVPGTLPHNFSLFDFPFNGIQYLNQMGVPWCIQNPLVNDHIPDAHVFSDIPKSLYPIVYLNFMPLMVGYARILWGYIYWL